MPDAKHEILIEVLREMLMDPNGPASDMTSGTFDFNADENPYIELVGRLDLQHLASEMIAFFTEALHQPEEAKPEGVWVIADRDYYETISEVYPDELSALRALNGRGTGRVVFVNYGDTGGSWKDQD
jgi:hypothetical protein